LKKFQYNYTEINFFGENNKLLLFFLAKIPCGDSDVIPADSDEKTLYNVVSAEILHFRNVASAENTPEL